MDRIRSRSRLPRRNEHGRQRTVRQFLPAVHPETLEDRIVLSSPNWAAVGSGLAGVFNQLQASVNDHLLAPKAVAYSLPLVGTQLGQSSDPVGQVFAGLAGQVQSAFHQTPTGPNDVVTDLGRALGAFNPKIAIQTNTATAATFSVQASTTSPSQLAEQVDLQLGLPGLQLVAVAAPKAVNASLTFSL